jgi:hypothetical protein
MLQVETSLQVVHGAGPIQTSCWFRFGSDYCGLKNYSLYPLICISQVVFFLDGSGGSAARVQCTHNLELWLHMHGIKMTKHR